MIKFFRRIRHNLINEGKTARYLKYAIGEILLVVIGILIALQINNWNDERKAAIVDDALRKEYIRDLYSEIQSNILDIDSRINNYQKSRDGAEYLLKSIEGDCLKIGNINRLMDAYGNLYQSFRSEELSVYDEMRVSGKLNMIKDDTLLINLRAYYALDTVIAEMYQNYISSRQDLLNYMSENSPLREKYNFFDGNGFSFKFLEYIFRQEGFIKYVRKIYSFSRNLFNRHLFLRDNAQFIIDYMDNHYSDILNVQ